MHLAARQGRAEKVTSVWCAAWDAAGARGRCIWQAATVGGMVGRMLQALGSAVLGAGICACEGELRALSDLPARKNDVRLRFNSASGSSPELCKPSTCEFVNALCPDTEPARLKRKRVGFSGPPGTAGLQTAFGSKEKRPTRGVFQSRRAPGVRRGSVRHDGFPNCAGRSVAVGRIVAAG